MEKPKNTLKKSSKTKKPPDEIPTDCEEVLISLEKLVSASKKTDDLQQIQDIYTNGIKLCNRSESLIRTYEEMLNNPQEFVDLLKDSDDDKEPKTISERLELINVYKEELNNEEIDIDLAFRLFIKILSELKKCREGLEKSKMEVIKLT